MLTTAAVSSAAESPVRQILLLHTFDRGNLVLDEFTGNFRVELERRAGGPVNFVQVVVGPTGFISASERSVVNYIRSAYSERLKPDLIVSIGAPAAVFARKYRQQLFPELPLLFASIDQRFVDPATLARNETVVAVVSDFSAIVDDILQALPHTKQVFMIVGHGPIREFWHQTLQEQFQRFRGRVTFVWSDDLSWPEIMRRTSNLPADSAIFFLTLGTDATGAAYADERVLSDLGASANAPIFSAHDVYLGQGIVGGRLLGIHELSRRTSDVAYRILNGESPEFVRVPAQLPGQPQFDWRELRRWHIPEERLPQGSLVKFRAPTLWSEYRGAVLTTAAALLIQALLIFGLLLERRARQAAENESRRNLSLAADINRRETMSALSSSITHDLVQPLGAMMHNSEALQMMISKRSATPANIDEILSDIHADSVRAVTIIERSRNMLRSRQLQMQPLDLQALVKDSLALVGQDLRAQQIGISVNVPAGPCVISGDAVMLQQVLVNLMMNAIEAMAQTPPGLRHMDVGVDVDRASVDLTVRDTGPGLPEGLATKLFTPFVTTKPHGLGIGLAMARSIVEAHGGSISARTIPEGGAEFTVTLRARHARESKPEDSLVHEA